ncbi:MAG TPA: hypothetical protein VGK29_20600 [Paludibaculum sp.]
MIQRFRDGGIPAAEFLALKQRIDSDPDVSEGKWYKRFRSFTLAGNGEMPSTFLTPGMAVTGEEVQ